MDTFTLQLTSMAHGGSALGRAGDKVVFVPYTLPGETVEVRLVEDRGRWATAELVRVIKSSPDRVTPPCPHFGLPRGQGPGARGQEAEAEDEGRQLEGEAGEQLEFTQGCGGCQWQHIAYPAQLRLKRAVVRDQFARVGKLPDVDVRPTIGMDEPWYYRNHVQFHVAEDGRLGFRALREHTVIPIQACYIMQPEVEALWKSLDLEFPELRQVVLRGDMGTDDRLALLRSNFDELPELEVDFPVSINLELSDGQVVTLIGAPWLMARAAGRDFRVSADAFFQVNTRMAEVLVRQVREGLRPHGGQTLLDLYAGVGLFGLALAGAMGEVIAIEEHPAAVRDWEVNAQGLANARLLPGKVEAVLPTLDESVDLVVLDPPRAGVEPVALDALAALRAPRIVYVSCDPATLARDAARLVQHGYRVRYVQPVD
ncbi:MAG: class I SAM-dependent RNA methyltransferase, partial [Anaerolineae bacterium]|nr:class I SAM-dependent RNA methyltransferase [Anaerolineae bacterium]